MKILQVEQPVNWKSRCPKISEHWINYIIGWGCRYCGLEANRSYKRNIMLNKQLKCEVEECKNQAVIETTDDGKFLCETHADEERALDKFKYGESI